MFFTSSLNFGQNVRDLLFIIVLLSAILTRLSWSCGRAAGPGMDKNLSCLLRLGSMTFSRFNLDMIENTLRWNSENSNCCSNCNIFQTQFITHYTGKYRVWIELLIITNFAYIRVVCVCDLHEKCINSLMVGIPILF